MPKKDPLGENPLAESVLRDMISGGKKKQNKAKRTSVKKGTIPAIRKSPTTITPGGLLRKTVYFSESEWRAIKEKAYYEDRPYTDIVREAIRNMLNVKEEK